jgi:hypothetical protein
VPGSNHPSRAGLPPAFRKWLPLVCGVAVVAGLAGGIYLGIESRPGKSAFGSASHTDGSEQDALASASGARDVAGASAEQPANDAGSQEKKKAAEQAAQLQQAAQQANAQQAALAAAQQELAQKAAEQAAHEKQLEDERARLDAEKQAAAAALAEAERQKAAAAEAERLRQLEAAKQARVYHGPGSGEIVWRGEVHGTSLVTIEGNSSDSGEIVSGGLPGVLVMVQPVDGKHVGIASTPAPSNAFRRLVLRIQGNGNVQEVVHWSIP